MDTGYVDAQATVPKVDIKLNGNTVTGQTVNVIVGQEMNLTTSVQPSNGTVTNSQWTLPGGNSDRIANYVVTFTDSQSPTSATVTNLATLNNSSVDFYWISGGNGRTVQYSAKVNGKSVHAQVTFNVQRPTASIMTSTGTPNVFVPSYGGLAGVLALEYGDASPGTPGITFTESVNMPQGFGGDIEWAQVINDTTRTRTTNANVQETQHGSGVLDTRYFYPFTTNNGTEDSPGVALTTNYKAYSISDTFTMYLMFVPTGTAGRPIYVPLRKVSWSWTGNAFRFGSSNDWTLNSSSKTTNPNADVTDCPQWTANVTSLGYH
jgi:hypothetical protein